MNISVFGTGYVGLVSGTCFAELGNTVTCVDIDQNKVEGLKQGIIPIYEPGLEELVQRNFKEGRLFFTTDGAAAVHTADVIFIAVGTPPREDGSANLQYVFDVAKTIGQEMNGYKVIVNKSTVPVGTGERVEEVVKKHLQDTSLSFSIVSNPEFLKEGEAIDDFMIPDRVIIGVEDERAKELMYSIYKPLERINRPIVFTSVKSAELIKYASNAMLATRISFMNELSHLCEKLGSDIKEIALGIGLDDRIGPRFLQAGIGYGGSCFPKDVQALSHILQEHECSSALIDAVEAVNVRQKRSLFPKIHALLGEHLTEKKIAVLGLAFKPKTDDMREAPSIEIIRYLYEKGAVIQAFDPVAISMAKKVLSDVPVHYFENAYDTVKDADLIIFVTEWNEFRMLDFAKVSKLVRQKNIIDGRNIFDPQQLKQAGFRSISVGREQWYSSL